uniref:Uncharacterized protein n=1 Tax=Triticum urartu TaxID=4572 RepID=A0A8R7PA93_TRIUA
MLLPLPRCRLAAKLRSTEPAATVSNHGASLVIEPGLGPLLPAAHTTRMPLDTALNAPIAMGSSSKLALESPPRESESTSTPSLMASSRPASTVDCLQRLLAHTLYMAM